MALTKTERLARFTSILALTALAIDPVAPANGSIWLNSAQEIRAQVAAETVILNRISVVTLAECGGKPNDPTFDNKAALLKLFGRAAIEGKKAEIGAGVWHTSPVLYQPPADLFVVGEGRAKIKGLPGDGPDAVIRLDPGTGVSARLIWSNVVVDNSERGFVHAAASGTALNIVRFRRYLVEKSEFYAGENWTVGKGDSGLVINSCGPGLVIDNLFQGQPDKGIYATGGGSNLAYDDFGDWVFAFNTYYRCQTPAAFTRQTRRGRFVSETVIECNLGLGRTEAGANPTITPAREIIAIGCTFKKIGSRAFRFHMEGGDQVVACSVEDWGFNPITGELSETQDAVRIQGASGVECDITFNMRDWAVTANHNCYDVRSMTIDGVTSQSRGVTLKGTVRNLPAGVGIMVNSGAFGVHSDMMYENVAVPVYDVTGNSGSRHVIRRPDGTRVEQHGNVTGDRNFLPTIQIVGQPDALIEYGTDAVDRLGRVERVGNHAIVTYRVRARLTFSGVGDIRIGGFGLTCAGDGGNAQGFCGIDLNITRPPGTVDVIAQVAMGTSYIRLWASGADRLINSGDCISGEYVRMEGSVVLPVAAVTHYPWTPAQAVASLLGWFDAADPLALTITDGKVANWINKGLAATALTQADAAKRPSYTATGWDGTLPCISATGLSNGQLLATASEALKGDHWIFIVAERAAQDDADAASGYRPMLATIDAAGYRLLAGVRRPSVDVESLALTVPTGTNATLPGYPVSAKGLIFADGRSTMKIALNGAAPSGAGTHGTAEPIALPSPAAFALFGDPLNNARRFAGKIAEVLVVNPALLPGGGTDEERHRFTGYLAWKWGLQANMPVGHPYAGAAPTI